MAHARSVARRGEMPDWMDLMDWMTPEGWSRPWRGATVRIEEYREGDEHVIRAQIPGVDPDKDITVSLEEGVLTIEASRTQSSKVESASGYRSEFAYGSFMRAVPVPSDVNPQDVKASYENGILEVRLKRTSSSKEAQRIPIHHNGH